MACSSSVPGGLLLRLSPFGAGVKGVNTTRTALFHGSVDAHDGQIPSLSTSTGSRSGRRCSRSSVSALTTGDLRPELDEYPEGIISGEWPENFSLLSYDDLRAYFESQPIVNKKHPSAILGDVMSVPVRTASADQTLEEIERHFEVVSGLPVVDGELRCIGVISKSDMSKASLGLKTTVHEVMSSPAITLSPDKSIMDAAALMLNKKVHRIPITNEKNKVIGIVTHTDVLQALEALEA